MPKLDLHGEDRVGARILVRDFLNDNYKLENYEIAIIHGIGSGILKREVHDMLRKDKRVEQFGTDYFNSGCTLVKLFKKVDKFEQKCYNTQHMLRGNRNV